MPEIPATRILDRELSLQITKEIRDAAGPALREAVDECIRVFERCAVSARGTDEHIGLLFPLLQLAETIDAVELVLQGASAVGAGVLLRSAFETLLTIEWVAKRGVEKYGAAYVVADIHRRLVGLEQYKKEGQRRDQLQAALKADKLPSAIVVPVIGDAEQQTVGLRQLLEAPHLKDASMEYERARGTKTTIDFYALWEGPRTVEQLARRLGRSGQYEVLYRWWSLTVHGVDLKRQLRIADGTAGVQPLRSGEGLKDTYSFALYFCLEGMRAVLGYYRPDELTSSFSRWHEMHMQSVVRRLGT